MLGENFPRKIPDSLFGSFRSAFDRDALREFEQFVASMLHRTIVIEILSSPFSLARPCSLLDRLFSTTPVDSTAKRRKTSGNPYALDGQRVTRIAGACASPVTSPTHIRPRIRRVVLDVALARYLHSPSSWPPRRIDTPHIVAPPRIFTLRRPRHPSSLPFSLTFR